MAYSRYATKRRTYKKKVSTAPSKKKVIKKALNKSKVNYIKRIVRSVITKKVETKIADPYTQSNVAVLPYDTTNNKFGIEIPMTNILSTITQGTGQGQRIGNRINVVSMTMKGYVNCQRVDPNSGDNQNMYLKLLWVRRKMNLLPINSSSPSNFFQNGNTTIGPTNQPSDILRQVNKDVYTVFTSRLFKLGFSDGGLSGGQTSHTQAPNNDFKVSKFFKVSLKKHINKIIYDDNTSIPNNWGCSIVPLLCYADGSAMTTSTFPSVELNFDLECKYKDY